MSYTMYGIKNCNTIKKAKTYLETHEIPYEFHDYRSQGIDRTLIEHFLTHFSIDDLLNRRGMTWRQLTDDEKNAVTKDQEKAIELMLAKPAIIKRPILEHNSQALLGFSDESYAQFLAQE